jgi:hypothetical protein
VHSNNSFDFKKKINGFRLKKLLFV